MLLVNKTPSTFASCPKCFRQSRRAQIPCLTCFVSNVACWWSQGFKYESPAQPLPEFDAKGIETVRRDACPAVAKMLEATLRILFRTKDLSQV